MTFQFMDSSLSILLKLVSLLYIHLRLEFGDKELNPFHSLFQIFWFDFKKKLSLVIGHHLSGEVIDKTLSHRLKVNQFLIKTGKGLSSYIRTKHQRQIFYFSNLKKGWMVGWRERSRESQK